MTLEELLGMVLMVDPATLSDGAKRTEIAAWDSLTHLSVVAGVEETYDVLLSTAEMRDIDSVGSLRAMLQAKGVGV